MKNKTAAAILALFFGGFGIHRFYLRQFRLGAIYFVFVWTLIPIAISLIDFFVFLTMSEEKFNNKYNH